MIEEPKFSEDDMRKMTDLFGKNFAGSMFDVDKIRKACKHQPDLMKTPVRCKKCGVELKAG